MFFTKTGGILFLKLRGKRGMFFIGRGFNLSGMKHLCRQRKNIIMPLDFTERSTILLHMGRTTDAKEKLLTAALELIWEQSYHSVGVGSICERAGVKKGSFYHFFRSKAELVSQAIHAYWDSFKLELDVIFSPTKPPLKRLMDYFEMTHSSACDRRESGEDLLGCLFIGVGSESVNLEPLVWEKVTDIMDEYFKYFQSTIQEAHAKGTIHVADPEAAARWLFNFFEGTLANGYIKNDLNLLNDLKPGCMQLLGVKV